MNSITISILIASAALALSACSEELSTQAKRRQQKLPSRQIKLRPKNRSK